MYIYIIAYNHGATEVRIFLNSEGSGNIYAITAEFNFKILIYIPLFDRYWDSKLLYLIPVSNFTIFLQIDKYWNF